MNNLQIGFGRVDVTPPLNINIAGYFKVRLADGVLDELEVNAVAFSCGDKKAVMMSVDNLGIMQVHLNQFKEQVAKATGLPTDAVFICCTHTHTGPEVNEISETGCICGDLEKKYRDFLADKIVEVAIKALSDLKPAKAGFAVGQAPNISFIRRFKMKDGSVATNPGPDNPEIDCPIGEVDESVNVIRFERENAETVVILSFGTHPDTVGGNKISADWPGFTRRIFERAVGNAKCMFLNGMQGDVNHVNVHPTGGFNNDMILDFDDVMRGYGHARHMGNVVAGGAMQVYDKVEYIDVDDIDFIQKKIKVPSNMPSKEQLPLARKYCELHNAGKDDEIPFSGMALTTVVAEAQRMVKLENGPEYFDMVISGLKIGSLAFIGIPGEPFTGIGTKLKESDEFSLITPVCIMNGYEGYFPMKNAYDEGGYESRSSHFKSGVAELIIKEGKEILSNLKK